MAEFPYQSGIGKHQYSSPVKKQKRCCRRGERVEAMEKIPDEWRPNERYITHCARCGAEILKRNAVAIYRLRRCGSMALLMHFCSNCYNNFLDDYGIGE